jgi:hypothetical protein
MCREWLRKGCRRRGVEAAVRDLKGLVRKKRAAAGSWG